MKITRDGVWFNYHGDEVLWLWWWKREALPNGKKGKYVSALSEGYFESLADYWMFWGGYSEACRQDKVYGYSDNQIFQEWAAMAFRHNIVVILKNINYELKPAYFWSAIPPRQVKELKKDVVVLFFNRMEDAKKIFTSIHAEFAEAYLYKYGTLENSNNEVVTQSGQVLGTNTVW
jgi:hypothetical protein